MMLKKNKHPKSVANRWQTNVAFHVIRRKQVLKDLKFIYDNNITSGFCVLRMATSDYNKLLILFSVIQLNGGHCGISEKQTTKSSKSF